MQPFSLSRYLTAHSFTPNSAVYDPSAELLRLLVDLNSNPSSAFVDASGLNGSFPTLPVNGIHDFNHMV